MSWYNPRTWFSSLVGGDFFTESYKPDEYFDDSHFENYKGSNVKKVRANTVYLNANDDFVSAIRHAEERGVIGAGLNVQVQTDDIEFNRDIETYIKMWSKKKHCMLNGMMHFNLACRTMVGVRKIQGGLIVRHHYNKKWAIPYKIELIGVDRIDSRKHDFKNGLFNGIQVNKTAEITGIWLFVDGSTDKSILVDYKHLNLYVVPFVDLTQYQPVPEIVPVLASLKMLREYSHAELKRAKRDSSNSIIVKSQHFATILSERIKKAKEANNVSDMTKAFNDAKIKGSIDGATYVPSTDDVQLLNKDSKSVYDSLQSNIQTMSSAGAGQSPQTILKNVKDVNYTSALFNSQNDNDYYEIQLDNLDGLVIDDIMSNLMDTLVMFGKVKKKDYFIEPDKYRIFEFMRKSTVHNDIAKTAKATDTSLANGSLTMIDHLASKNIDHETHIRKQIKFKQAEERIAKEMNYVAPTEPLKQKEKVVK